MGSGGPILGNFRIVLLMTFSVIDTTLWDSLKKQYPEKVEARLKGLPSNSVDELFQQNVSHIISDQGQIGKELEQEREHYELENKQLR